MSGHNLITINNCNVEGSKKTALQNINWNFKTGESWLVIGPNGGGKSNTLEAIYYFFSFIRI